MTPDDRRLNGIIQGVRAGYQVPNYEAAWLLDRLGTAEAELAKADQAFNRIYAENGKLHAKITRLEGK